MRSFFHGFIQIGFFSLCNHAKRSPAKEEQKHIAHITSEEMLTVGASVTDIFIYCIYENGAACLIFHLT